MPKKQLHHLLVQVEEIRKHSDLLAICPSNTGSSWLGVLNATLSLYPSATCVLPHYYSNPVFKEGELMTLFKKIWSLNFRNIIISGFLPYFKLIINEISKAGNQTKIKVIYHGFLAELAESKLLIESFNEIISLAKERKIHCIGFVKKGLALSFEKLFQIPSFEIILMNPVNNAHVSSYNDGKLHLGVLVDNNFRKNLHTQVWAALMVPNSIVHVLDDSELKYFGYNERIVAHGNLPHQEFIKLLGSMDINLHVTFSESSGGQVCSESFSQGVPCISAFTSSFFDHDKVLYDKLVVIGNDDSFHIYQKIMEVIPEIKQLSEHCLKYSELMNNIAKKKAAEFINF